MKWLEGLLAVAEDLLPFLGRWVRALGREVGEIAWPFVNVISRLASDVWQFLTNYGLSIAVFLGVFLVISSPVWLYSWKRAHIISYALFVLGVGFCGLFAGLPWQHGIFTVESYFALTPQQMIALFGGGFVGVRGFDDLRKTLDELKQAQVKSDATKSEPPAL